MSARETFNNATDSSGRRQGESAYLMRPRAAENPSAEAQRCVHRTLMDISHASRYLNCSERYLRRLVQERRVPFIRLGGRKIRFSLHDLDSWVDAQRVPARR